MSRFLQHLLLHHFVKVRYYGFYGPRKRQRLESVHELFKLAEAKEQQLQDQPSPSRCV